MTIRHFGALLVSAVIVPLCYVPIANGAPDEESLGKVQGLSHGDAPPANRYGVNNFGSW